MGWTASRPGLARITFVFVFLLFGSVRSPIVPAATDEPFVALYALDVLTQPNQTARVETKLVRRDGTRQSALAGESLELFAEGTVEATATTNADGRATLSYVPKRKGVIHVTIRTAGQASVQASTTAQVAAWERRTPVLAVEIAALRADVASEEPSANAADELGKLAQFYYNLLYVLEPVGGETDVFRAASSTRQWLDDHKFPVGSVLVLPSGEGALGKKIDELRSAGWTTLKVGVGRTKRFAEAFLERRLEAILVPEPSKGEAPRKAKVAKDWKEVRKKL